MSDARASMTESDNWRGGDDQQYYVTCHPGLEEVVAAELASPEIRARSIRPGKAGVFFR